MITKSTLSSSQPNAFRTQQKNRPELQTLKNILAFSKSLEVIRKDNMVLAAVVKN